jgi:hypothetical protein
MASNIQRGPRSLSAGDWVRMKRIKGDAYTQFSALFLNKDITNPPPRLETRDGGRHVYTEFGTSKTRRPASNFIGLKAFASTDYVLESGGPGDKSLVAIKLCECGSTNAVKHNGPCVTCQYDKVVVR